MSDYRFGGDYKLSIYPKDAMDCWGEIDIDKVEAVEIEWVDFIRKPDDKSRWAKLFGTPERAARTLIDSCNDDYDYGCGGCPVARVNCKCGDYYALLEWLRGESDGE